jgi:hypothetical protein
MSHVAFATCDNLSLECKVHTSSSASRPLLITLSQRHGCKIHSSSRQVRPLRGHGNRSQVQSNLAIFWSIWLQCLRSFSVAPIALPTPSLSLHILLAPYTYETRKEILIALSLLKGVQFSISLPPFLTLWSSILSQILSRSALLATHDCINAVVRRWIGRQARLAFFNHLSGCGSGGGMDRFSCCLRLSLWWRGSRDPGSISNGCRCHYRCSRNVLWRRACIDAMTRAGDISMSFGQGIRMHWSTELLPPICGRLIAFRSPSPSLRVTIFPLLNLSPDPAHRSPSFPFAIREDAGVVRSTRLAWGLCGCVACIGHRTSKRYRLLEAASGLRR